MGDALTTIRLQMIVTRVLWLCKAFRPDHRKSFKKPKSFLLEKLKRSFQIDLVLLSLVKNINNSGDDNEKV